MRNFFRKNNGDTIVEVLIAIVVLGGALAAAFAITNRSKLTTYTNHERYQAQLYANKQAEMLRNAFIAYDTGHDRVDFPSDITSPNSGCFAEGPTGIVWTTTSCSGIDGIYSINVTHDSSADTISASVASVTYSITVSWDRVGGGQDRVQLFYGL